MRKHAKKLNTCQTSTPHCPLLSINNRAQTGKASHTHYAHLSVVACIACPFETLRRVSLHSATMRDSEHGMRVTLNARA